jgi:hypothetical protein
MPKSQQAWVREAADEAVLNNVHKKKKNFTSKGTTECFYNGMMDERIFHHLNNNED